MIVVSCDRPEHMRGVRASQTTDHRAVLAGSVRHFRELPAGAPPKNLGGLVQRAVRAARGAGNGTVPGPVHFNVGFVEPLMPDQPWKTVGADIAQAQRGMERGSGERCVVVAGTTRNRKLDPALFAGILSWRNPVRRCARTRTQSMRIRSCSERTCAPRSRAQS